MCCSCNMTGNKKQKNTLVLKQNSNSIAIFVMNEKIKNTRFALILNVESYLNSNILQTSHFPHPFPISVEIFYFMEISLFEYDQISNNVFVQKSLYLFA